MKRPSVQSSLFVAPCIGVLVALNSAEALLRFIVHVSQTAPARSAATMDVAENVRLVVRSPSIASKVYVESAPARERSAAMMDVEAYVGCARMDGFARGKASAYQSTLLLASVLIAPQPCFALKVLQRLVAVTTKEGRFFA